MEFKNEFEVSDIQNLLHDGVVVQDNNDTYTPMPMCAGKDDVFVGRIVATKANQIR
jgi:aspartate-semialdehyde dehydrogenase